MRKTKVSNLLLSYIQHPCPASASRQCAGGEHAAPRRSSHAPRMRPRGDSIRSAVRRFVLPCHAPPPCSRGTRSTACGAPSRTSSVCSPTRALAASAPTTLGPATARAPKRDVCEAAAQHPPNADANPMHDEVRTDSSAWLPVRTGRCRSDRITAESEFRVHAAPAGLGATIREAPYGIRAALITRTPRFVAA